MEIAINGINQKWFHRSWIISLLEKLKIEIHYVGNKINLVYAFSK